MARAAKPAPAKARTVKLAKAPAPVSAEPAPVAQQPVSGAWIETLQALHAEHGAVLEMPSTDQLVPGSVVHGLASTPASVERFVAAIRAHALVRHVQVLPTQIVVEIEVPSNARAEG